MKDYQRVKIVDCGEPLLLIPLDNFVIETPPPYEKLGADYGGISPYSLRSGVIDALLKASYNLDKIKPHWKIKIFDAFRPIQVQQFMVNYTFECLCLDKNLDRNQLTLSEKNLIYEEVYKFWAIASDNPHTPPPHSTGAAIDVTLVDEMGNIVEMGGDIDEIGDRSHPNYYCNYESFPQKQYHESRKLLNEIMISVGFTRHPNEWWHFSLGDQMWAWLSNLNCQTDSIIAKYGKVN